MRQMEQEVTGGRKGNQVRNRETEEITEKEKGTGGKKKKKKECLLNRHCLNTPSLRFSKPLPRMFPLIVIALLSME